MKYLIVAFCVLAELVGRLAAAQATVTIRGTVRDATTGEGLFGATVLLRRAGVGTSGEDENFALKCPRSSQPDTLVVSYVGYQRKRLVVVPQADLQLRISLRPTSSFELAQVEVKAKQPIAEDFVLQKLDYLRIVTNPAAAADPLLAVRTLPAATTTDESANISLRGSDPSQTGIYLNNAPVYDAVKFAQLNGLGTFSIFNPNLVKSLLVFPSNPPLEFGNAGAGLIAIATDDKRAAASLEVGVGLANSGFFATLPTGQKSQLKLYGNVQTGTLLRAVNPKAFADLSTLFLGDAGCHFAMPLGAGGTLKLFGYSISEQYGYQYEGPTINDTYRYNKRRALYIGSYERVFAKADLSFSQSMSLANAHTAIGNYNAQLRNLDWFSSLAYRYYWSDRFSSRVGVSFDQRNARIAGQFPQYSYALGPAFPAVADTIRRSRTLGEFFHYTKLNLGTWVVGVGMRSSLPGMAFSYQSYQASARYNFSSTQFVNLAAGQYHTVTTPEPTRYAFQLTQIRQLALDYSYTALNWTLTAAVYAKRQRGLASTNIVGAEVYAQRAFGKRVTGDLAAATVHAQAVAAPLLANSLLYTATLRDIPFNLKSSWQVVLPWCRANLVAQYRAGVPYTPIIGSSYDGAVGAYQPFYAPQANGSRLPPYFRVDIGANKSIKLRSPKKSLLVYAVLNNVTNTHNVSDYNYSDNYASTQPQYFQLRSVYLGLIFGVQ